MRIKFQPYYFIAFATLFLIEVCITLVFKTGFIRHTVGDFIVTILLYCLIKSFIVIKPMHLGIIVLIISYTVEFLQLANILDYLSLRGNTLAHLILGTSFSVQDLIAYSLGVILALVIDLKINNKP